MQVCRKENPLSEVHHKNFQGFCCNFLKLEKCILDHVDSECVISLQKNYATDNLKLTSCRPHLQTCIQEYQLDLPYLKPLLESNPKLLSRKPVFETNTSTQTNASPGALQSSTKNEDQPMNDESHAVASENAAASTGLCTHLILLFCLMHSIRRYFSYFLNA